eukprot:1158576-Pelagomonas_calceolata.AAC.1
MAQSARCAGGCRTPAEAKRCLQGTPELLEGCDVMVMSDQEHGPCMPKWKGHGEVMSPTTPSNHASSTALHASTLAKEEMIHMDDGDAGLTALLSATRSKTPYMPSARSRMLSTRKDCFIITLESHFWKLKIKTLGRPHE